MKLALLKGNRFNPWHLQGFKRLPGNPEIVAFRADSEVQQRFGQRDDGSAGFAVEPIYFDTQAGNPFQRMMNVFGTRYLGREAHIVPFYERLQGFDVIQSWELFTDWSEQAVTARERFQVPLSVMVWDNIPFNMERDPRRRENKSRVIAGTDRFLVYSERSRRTLEIEGVDAARITPINPGVDTELFCPGAPDRAPFGLTDEDFVILFVGWLLPRKGIDFLLLALRELLADSAANHRRIRLLVAGSGPGKDRVDALAARLNLSDACVFLDPQPYNRMPDVFRAANVFVLPSIATSEWQEQFGMSLIEAMACEVPAVATLSGAIPEIAGEAAALCQPNDFLSLFHALKRIVENDSLRHELAAAGHSRALEHYDLRTHTQALADVYNELIRG